MQNLGLRKLADMVHQYCGLNYFNNLDSLENKILKRLNELSLSYWEYCCHLQKNPKEWDLLVEYLTINETYFYREENQLQAFQSQVLPEIREKSPLRIWSAGCSTGEEPYTLAMLIAETGLFSPGTIEIIASDINRRVLQIAEQGWYLKRSLSFRKMPSELLEKYFVEQDDRYQVTDSIRKMVQFRKVNLLDSKEVEKIGKVDIIFCRNVLIYFDNDTIRKVVTDFYNRLRSGGYLFLGHAESILGWDIGFHTIHTETTFYYRKEDPLDATVRSIGSR